MRLRGLLIGVSGLAVAATAGAVLAAPLLADRLGAAITTRLARETGLRWQIGRTALSFSGLVLEDVAFDGADLRGRLRRATAAGPIGLLLGHGGTVSATVEGASLNLPLALPAAAGAGGGSDLNLSALRAVIRGGDAVLDDGGRRLALALSKADLALDLAAGPGGRDPAFRLEMPDQGLVAEAAGAPAGAARTVNLTLAPAGGPKIEARTEARLGASGLRLDRIGGTIDGAPFSGTLVAERSGRSDRPRLDLGLALDALALAEAGSAMRVDPVGGLTVPIRIDLVPDPAWFAGYEGQAAITVQRLAAGAVRATAVGLTARVRDGRLDASLDNAALYGGSARGRYVLEPEGRHGRHQIGLSLTGVQVLPLLRQAAGVDGLDGSGTARLDIQATGGTPQALLRSARGQSEVTVTDGRIDGLDLARAAGITAMPGALATRLDRLGARFTVADGQAGTDDLQLKTGLIEAEGAGRLDLVARTIDLRLKPLKVTAGGRLNVPIQISGSWDAPAVSADLAGLAQDPAGTLQSLQDLGNNLLGGQPGRERGEPLGESLGGLLDALIPRPAPRRRP